MSEKKITLADVEKEIAKSLADGLKLGEAYKAQLELAREDALAQVRACEHNLLALGTQMFAASKAMLAGMGVNIEQISQGSKPKGVTRTRMSNAELEAVKQQIIAVVNGNKAGIASGAIAKLLTVSIPNAKLGSLLKGLLEAKAIKKQGDRGDRVYLPAK